MLSVLKIGENTMTKSEAMVSYLKRFNKVRQMYPDLDLKYIDSLETRIENTFNIEFGTYGQYIDWLKGKGVIIERTNIVSNN